MGVMRKLPVVPICRNPTALPLHPNQRQISRYPVLTKRGVSRSSRTLGAGCGGRFGDARRATLTRTAKSCGPDAPTLASSLRVRSQATVAKEPGHRGEHEISSKTIARGRPGELAEPVVTTLVCFVLFCTRGCGCGHASGFPCALLFSRVVCPTARARCVARTRTHVRFVKTESANPDNLAPACGERSARSAG